MNHSGSTVFVISPCKIKRGQPYGLFYCKPPDTEIELLVDLIGWRYVEQRPVINRNNDAESQYEYVLCKTLYSANKGVKLN